MKRSLLGLVLLAVTLPAGAKTFAAPILDSTGKFTFDVPRIITNATISVSAGGGWITLTTDQGETAQRWVQQGAPYTATFTSIYASIPGSFTKLAKSVTFGATTNTTFAITNLIVQDRFPVSFAPVWSGTVKTVDPVTNTVTIQLESNATNGPQFGVAGGTQTANAGTGAGPIIVDVALYDANGVYITTIQVTLPVI
jgi:hypothetical protein